MGPEDIMDFDDVEYDPNFGSLPDPDASIDMIEELCTNRCVPELMHCYVQLNNVLNKCNFSIHLDELDVLRGKMNSQTIDILGIVPAVDEIMRTAINRALLELGVEFSADIRIEMLVEAAEQLLLFDPTDNPTLITNTMEGTEDDSDALCRLLELIGTYTYDDWFTVVYEVSDSFTRNLVKVCRKVETFQETPAGDPGFNSKLFQRVGRMMKEAADTHAGDLVTHAVGVGASLESLYGVHVGRYVDMEPTQAVRELYALAAMSSESFESAERTIGVCLDDLYQDVMQRGAAERSRKRIAETFKPIFGEE